MHQAPKGWQSPLNFLILMSMVVPIAFATWQTLLNNFVIEKVGFTGADIGLLQSVREIPGLIAFTAVWVLLVLSEQRFVLGSLFLLALGTALTGVLPSYCGLLVTTLMMSIGFHYVETLKQSLSLQWLSKSQAPEMLGKLIAVGAFTSIIVYGVIALMMDGFGWDYRTVYLLMGGVAALLVLLMWSCFPQFQGQITQRKGIVIRRRYSLYYMLVFLSGARRQIFVVFAGFLMVEKFHYSVGQIAALFLINCAINTLFAKRIGRLIGSIGERKALSAEYIGLIVVFLGYAYVDNAHAAAGLYVIDHLLFSLALALKTYFQKIADAEDIASTAAVSFTIGHIVAVVIPVTFGYIWLQSPALVFEIGAAIALVSLLLAQKLQVDASMVTS